MVSDGERCDDRMRGGVNGRNSIGVSILYEGLGSITRNYHSLAKVSGRDGRDHTQCSGIDDRDCAIMLVGSVNLLTVGGNGNSHRFSSNRNGRDHLLCRRVDRGYGVVPVVGDVDAVTRGRDAKTTGSTSGGDIRYLVGGSINHVHFSLGSVRDICEASIQREQDVFALMPGEKDCGEELIGYRINDGDGAAFTERSLMHHKKTSTIRRDTALSRYIVHRDGGNVSVRHRV